MNSGKFSKFDANDLVLFQIKVFCKNIERDNANKLFSTLYFLSIREKWKDEIQ